MLSGFLLKFLQPNGLVFVLPHLLDLQVAQVEACLKTETHYIFIFMLHIKNTTQACTDLLTGAAAWLLCAVEHPSCHYPQC